MLVIFRRLSGALKTAWLMFGIALLMLLTVEGGLSLAFLVNDLLRPGNALGIVVADTYDGAPWVRRYVREFDLSNVLQWRPYVYWRRSAFQGEFINIDSSGLRRTTGAGERLPASQTPMKIWMFGGSTMWGTGARDGFTIPSILARELQNAGLDAEIVNFGEAGYVSTQEVIALALELRGGRIPTLVIFYDGINDTWAAYQNQSAGQPQNESNRVREFNLSRPNQTWTRQRMVLQDIGARLATRRFLEHFSRKSDRAASDATRFPGGADDTESLAKEVLSVYEGNVSGVNGLAEHYGFQCLFYWQPTIFQKPYLTAYEQSVRRQMSHEEAFFRTTYDLVRDRQKAGNRAASFQDLSAIFTDVQEPMYVDSFHLGEAGNAVVAKRIAKDVVALLASRKPVP